MHKTKYKLTNKLSHKQLHTQPHKQLRKQTQNYRRSHMHTGGRVLGEGAFGCVVHPSIKCANVKTDGTTVSKIITISDDIHEEIALLDLIRKLDPEMKYFVTYIGACYIKKISDRPDIEKVEFSNEENYKTLETQGALKKKR